MKITFTSSPDYTVLPDAYITVQSLRNLECPIDQVEIYHQFFQLHWRQVTVENTGSIDF